jgi:hypothetical protein
MTPSFALGACGAPTAVDDLGAVARVAGVAEIGALGKQAQRRAVAQPAEGRHRNPALIHGTRGRRGGVLDDDAHTLGARSGDEPPGPGEICSLPASVAGMAGVGAISAVSRDRGREKLAGGLRGERPRRWADRVRPHFEEHAAPHLVDRSRRQEAAPRDSREVGGRLARPGHASGVGQGWLELLPGRSQNFGLIVRAA